MGQRDFRRRSRALGLAAGLVLALGLTACGPDAALKRLPVGERGRVVSVPSADVIVLDNGLTVRLAQIEAPYPDEPGGAQAQADLQGLVGGRMVELVYGGAGRDDTGRALAMVRRLPDGLWIQAALVKDGWARVRTYADNHVLVRALLDDEAVARKASRGVWAIPADGVRLPSEIGRGQRGFQIVEGRVLSVTSGRAGGILEFFSDHRGFGVIIPPSALPAFRAARLSPATLSGQLIRVRGSVGWDSLMLIDHPEAIERLRAR